MQVEGEATPATVAPSRGRAAAAVVPRSVYWRTQALRGFVAAAGALLAGLGGGLSLSHGGTIGTAWEAAIGWPSLIAVAIAMFAVFAPLPRSVRWLLFGVGTAVLFLLNIDVGWQWQVGFGVLGFGLSWAMARAVRRLLQWYAGLRRSASPAVVALVPVLLIMIAFAADPANAQAVAPCDAGGIVLVVDGARHEFSAEVDAAEVIEVEISGDRAEFEVVATSAFERGTVVVELLESRPFYRPSWSVLPRSLRQDPVVWVGELEPTTGVAGGTTGRSDVDIVRAGAFSAFELQSTAHEGPIGIVAGEGRYRATFTDAATDATCFLDGRIRITAGPLTTYGGIAAMFAAVIGFGLSGGAVIAGEYTPAGVPRRPLHPPRGLPRPVRSSPTWSLGSDAATPPRVESLELRSRTADGPPADAGEEQTYEMLLRFTVDVDDDVDVLEVDASATGLLSLVRFEPMLVFSQGGVAEIPLQLATDPDNVDLHTAVELEISFGGSPVATGSAALRRDAVASFTTRRHGGTGDDVIDLRDADARAVTEDVELDEATAGSSENEATEAGRS